MRDDFGNLAVGVAGGADTHEVLVANIPATIEDGAGELERGGGLRIGRARLARRRELVIRESYSTAKRGMRGETVIARIRLGDGERDLLVQRARQAAAPQGGTEAKVPFEDRRGLCHGPHHVRHDAELFLNRVEVPSNAVIGGVSIDRRDPAHRNSSSAKPSEWSVNLTIVCRHEPSTCERRSNEIRETILCIISCLRG